MRTSACPNPQQCSVLLCNDDDGQDQRMDEERWVGSKDVACMWICTREAPSTTTFKIVCCTMKQMVCGGLCGLK